ncbi:YkgJ family cysteine cluster protein [Pseudodesulfovibrio senegalensis]|uniref:YkgJ family cysteine cluster protein n=1 Tax=Pseudodesulfovibrio senegalensis TaxID=1721087 RepID=A0A6N6N2T5_9BACT|nr:YkgJ family cysteine cluster protein [Pseudodesulfovibrio senegalensis]KAB1442261.1 YkgJ family cysteine cluster protein [Pseudodesulfovibrio senegalensis]
MKTPIRKSPENKKTRFVLERGALSPLPLQMDLPAGLVQIADILPALFDIADIAFGRTVMEYEAKGLTLACGPGCGHCCKQLVPVSDHEALHLTRVVRSLKGALRQQVMAGFESGLDKLRSAGLLEYMMDFFRTRVHDTPGYREMQRKYWELDISCPFLVDDSCSIHPQRPITCRQYSVTGSPKNCRNVFTPGVEVAEIHQPVDLGGALAGFTGAGARKSRVVPIILSLAMEEELKDTELPELPAENMMGRFLDYASMCYCSKE